MSEDTPAQKQEPVPEPVPEPAAEPAVEPVPVEPAPVAAVEPAAEPAAVAAVEPTVEPAALPPVPEFAPTVQAVLVALAPGDPADAPYKPRRRGRTTLLIAAALVLGVLAGAGAGYKIQHDRKPTPLSALTGPALVHPKGAGPDIAALPVGQDRNAVYDGDLLKLLLPTPKAKGTKQLERRWASLLEVADSFNGPGYIFGQFASNDFRRSAVASWTDARDTYVSVRLLQFRDEAATYTASHLADMEAYAADDSKSADGVDVPGTVDGQAYGSAEPYRKKGYLPLYSGHAVVRVGNIFVELYVESEHPVKNKTVMSLIKRQLERL